MIFRLFRLLLLLYFITNVRVKPPDVLIEHFSSLALQKAAKAGASALDFERPSNDFCLTIFHAPRRLMMILRAKLACMMMPLAISLRHLHMRTPYRAACNTLAARRSFTTFPGLHTSMRGGVDFAHAASAG